MNINYTEHLPADFNDNSRVWIYQSSRLFTMNEAFDMEDMLHTFVANWKSHGAPVKGFANLFFGQFIIILADESVTDVGGCSTDSSVHLVKEIEKKFSVDLFNRQSLAFIVKDKVQLLPLGQVEYALENNFIHPETLYFNNTVLTKKELLENWLIPVNKSWLGKRINFNKQPQN
jgi:hypothetical protein